MLQRILQTQHRPISWAPTSRRMSTSSLPRSGLSDTIRPAVSLTCPLLRLISRPTNMTACTRATSPKNVLDVAENSLEDRAVVAEDLPSNSRMKTLVNDILPVFKERAEAG
jgi:hypothetical protein